MSLKPYKPNQGVYARGSVGAGFLVLDVFASWRLYALIGGEMELTFLGIKLSSAVFWSAGLFLVVALLLSLCVFGFQMGWEALDSKTRAAVDLLIETENELRKVSWPGKEELRRSATVVIVCILVLGCFLYLVDAVVSLTMTGLEVLPPLAE